MSSWHRNNPELAGGPCDPWMDIPAHAAAYRELRDGGLIFVDGDDEEACEEIVDHIDVLSRAALADEKDKC